MKSDSNRTKLRIRPPFLSLAVCLLFLLSTLSSGVVIGSLILVDPVEDVLILYVADNESTREGLKIFTHQLDQYNLTYQVDCPQTELEFLTALQSMQDYIAVIGHGSPKGLHTRFGDMPWKFLESQLNGYDIDTADPEFIERLPEPTAQYYLLACYSLMRGTHIQGYAAKVDARAVALYSAREIYLDKNPNLNKNPSPELNRENMENLKRIQSYQKEMRYSLDINVPVGGEGYTQAFGYDFYLPLYFTTRDAANQSFHNTLKWLKGSISELIDLEDPLNYIFKDMPLYLNITEWEDDTGRQVGKTHEIIARNPNEQHILVMAIEPVRFLVPYTLKIEYWVNPTQDDRDHNLDIAHNLIWVGGYFYLWDRQGQPPVERIINEYQGPVQTVSELELFILGLLNALTALDPVLACIEAAWAVITYLHNIIQDLYKSITLEYITIDEVFAGTLFLAHLIAVAMAAPDPTDVTPFGQAGTLIGGILTIGFFFVCTPFWLGEPLVMEDTTVYQINGVNESASNDTDGDGIDNWDEAWLGSDPNDNDTDDDGLSDFYEVNVTGTHPNNTDTDFDGLPDASDSAPLFFNNRYITSDETIDAVAYLHAYGYHLDCDNTTNSTYGFANVTLNLSGNAQCFDERVNTTLDNETWTMRGLLHSNRHLTTQIPVHGVWLQYMVVWVLENGSSVIERGDFWAYGLRRGPPGPDTDVVGRYYLDEGIGSVAYDSS
ncbi:MAG: hypothetical protein ACFFBD_12275, partial [Candidatus Hodarchaeota archaeon]